MWYAADFEHLAFAYGYYITQMYQIYQWNWGDAYNGKHSSTSFLTIFSVSYPG